MTNTSLYQLYKNIKWNIQIYASLLIIVERTSTHNSEAKHEDRCYIKSTTTADEELIHIFPKALHD